MTGESVQSTPDPATFLSGEHGEVGGRRAVLRRAADAALDRRLARALHAIDERATTIPRRTVLVASVYRPPADNLAATLPSLVSQHHDIQLRLGSTAAKTIPGSVMGGLEGGKFENLNALLDGATADWLLVVDDDVDLPPRFLDRLVTLAELFGLVLAQPAQSLASHAAWRVTRRKPRSILRETRFVEIGPVTLFSKEAASELLPFPPLRYGWGLDSHWAALAHDKKWRLGIADALPVRHEQAKVGASYDTEAAIEEARDFLASRPYLSSAAAQQTIKTHRSLP